MNNIISQTDIDELLNQINNTESIASKLEKENNTIESSFNTTIKGRVFKCKENKNLLRFKYKYISPIIKIYIFNPKPDTVKKEETPIVWSLSEYVKQRKQNVKR
jgi:hypothetical protein